eukprot:CAMPEP_0197048888 /NCGR_PEP_ID=MMETSP1384-20130603/24148_1 /TAXON_ID=29189 /ORGANISM="Ammonia sp." /LENGTH=302 /DNA_ID=CAMNT_0042481093 /DNA_START=81 /DNA_END=989 /DNA_ORIENTATION=-
MAALHMSMYIVFCINMWICLVHCHASGTHPIGKLIKGTFVSYDDQGEEFARLYVCKVGGGKYHYGIIRSSTILQNYMVGRGYFLKADIGTDTNLISNINCFHQQHGHAAEVTPCEMDVASLCDDGKVTYSYSFDAEPITMYFFKVSPQLEGNDDLQGYQCAAPYTGELLPYPYAFGSAAIPWHPNLAKEIQVFTSDDAGCWANVDGASFEPDGTGSGDFSQRVICASGAAWIQQWKDDSLPHDDPCRRGSEIAVIVDQGVLLVGFQCSDGETGAGFLLYEATSHSTCPIGEPTLPLDSQLFV